MSQKELFGNYLGMSRTVNLPLELYLYQASDYYLELDLKACILDYFEHNLVLWGPEIAQDRININ
jgi:hypothetical protein